MLNYTSQHDKIAAYEAHVKAKCASSDQDLWYEQIIDLPLECERCFCLVEPEAPHGYCAIDLKGYKEIEIEMVEVSSNWYVTRIVGPFIDL